MWQMIEHIDIELFYLINQKGQNVFFDFFMPIMSNIKYFYIPLTLIWLFLIIKNNLKFRVIAVSILLLIALSEWFSSGLLKPLFNRPRPYHRVSGVHLYDRMFKTWSITPELKKIIRGESNSLPSSHSTNIFAATAFFTFYFRRFWPYFYLIAFLVGYSRVYLGVHFPFDVFVGGITGTLCGLLLAWSSNRVRLYLEKRFNW